MIKYILTKNEGACCGCNACVEICPVHCLEMIKSEDGFLYPEANNAKCIECGMCSSVCPMEKKSSELPTVFEAYGAYSTDSKTVIQSSSGGIFSVLAEYILGQDGMVFGAYLDENHELYHIGIDHVQDLYKLRGSKYIQSNINGIYCKVKEILINGKKVLFTGTPCQIYGLKQYLKKDYENLYTADVICHGVPSQKMFDEYVAFLERKHHAKLVDINFRDKVKNGWSITLRYTMQKGNKKRNYYLISPLSEYFSGFLGGYILRESCYDCKFCTLERPGDITMGDFWGYQKTRPELKHDEGLSLLLINSPKGKELKDVLEKSGVCFNEVSEETVRNSENKNLYTPSLRRSERDNIYKELNEHGFDYIAKKYLQKHFTVKNYAKNYLPKGIVKFLKK